MNKKTIVAFVIFLVILVGLSVFVYINVPSSYPNCTSIPPNIEFKKEKNTLIVVSIDFNTTEENFLESDLVWENVKIQCNRQSNGTATMPTGKIDVGDTLTNCTGTICLEWIPSKCGYWFWCEDFT